MPIRVIDVPPILWELVQRTRFNPWATPPNRFTSWRGNHVLVGTGPQLWSVEVGFGTLTDEEVDELAGFFADLNDPETRVRMGDRRREQPRGTPVGIGRVAFPGQTGNTLVTSGWMASQQRLFEKGDYVQVDNRLYILRDTVNSGPTGSANLPIQPRLRGAPADGVRIITERPRGIFAAIPPGWERVAHNGTGTVQLIEDPYAAESLP